MTTWQHGLTIQDMACWPTALLLGDELVVLRPFPGPPEGQEQSAPLRPLVLVHLVGELLGPQPLPLLGELVLLLLLLLGELLGALVPPLLLLQAPGPLLGDLLAPSAPC